MFDENKLCRTTQLSKELSRFNMGTDDTYLNTLTRNIFQKYFDSYIRLVFKLVIKMLALLIYCCWSLFSIVIMDVERRNTFFWNIVYLKVILS
jgi:hypothetical protein